MGKMCIQCRFGDGDGSSFMANGDLVGFFAAFVFFAFFSFVGFRIFKQYFKFDDGSILYMVPVANVTC
jgi:hypothetical protein